MRAEAAHVDDDVHGETLVVTYYIRKRQLKGGGIEMVLAFISRDVVRRVLSWAGPQTQKVW